jgi:energy-coupling factor transporter ATP-binding protein EcfA2
MSLLAAENVSVLLDGQEVLRHVDLSIDPGEIVTIVGPNGSGKTTLLRALIGAIPLSAGQVTRAKGLRLGYVPQKLAVDVNLPITVDRFLNLPTRRKRAAITQALQVAVFRASNPANCPICRAVSFSAFCWPAPCWNSPKFWCWMSRPKASTRWGRRPFIARSKICVPRWAARS